MKKKTNENRIDYSFFEHLELLRHKLLISIGFLFVFFITALFFADILVNLIKLPLQSYNITLHYFKPQEKLVSYVKISFYAALYITIPLFVLLLASFIFPALTKKEKMFGTSIVLFFILFYVIAAYFSYTIITPWILHFFYTIFTEDGITPVWNVSAYFDLVASVVFTISILLQFPVALLILIKLGIVKLERLKKSRKYICVGIFIVTAFLTPMTDPWSLLLLGGFLYLLFEITIAVAGLFYRQSEIMDNSNDGNSIKKTENKAKKDNDKDPESE